MLSYQEQALDILKLKGFRITRPRRLVIESLAQALVPLSAHEIKTYLDAMGEKVDTVSIYRILDCLEENGLIHRILSTGKVRKCQLDHASEESGEDSMMANTSSHSHSSQGHSKRTHCHHLVICSLCNDVQEVHCPGLEPLMKDIQLQSGFHLQTHHLEFSGICAACQQRKK